LNPSTSFISAQSKRWDQFTIETAIALASRLVSSKAGTIPIRSGRDFECRNILLQVGVKSISRRRRLWRYYSEGRKSWCWTLR